jgi:hypothetical protein
MISTLDENLEIQKLTLSMVIDWLVGLRRYLLTAQRQEEVLRLIDGEVSDTDVANNILHRR